MNNNNLARTALSPVSVAGSDWSGISRYQSYQSMQSNNSEYFSNGGADGGGASTHMGPPSRSATYNGNGPPGPPPLPQYGDIHNGPRPRDLRDGAPSPPSSVARSSDGAGLYSDGSLKGIVLEEELAIHHAALKRLLAQDLLNDRNPKQKRARDKLLRLSKVQFQELSGDVYDELQRRQLANDRRDSGSTPPYLLPKESFHPKRNQARMKLSTLPVPRFRDLAKDVFYELERRYPHFQDPNDMPVSPTGSMTSMRSFPQPPGPGRVGSPGPGRMGSPGPNGMRNGPPQGYPPGNLGVPGPGPGGPGGPPNQFGRPLPKTFQSNTIIPNKSTMVEEDDDDAGLDDDDPYGLEDNKRSTKDTLSDMIAPSGSSEGAIGMKRESSSSRVRSRAGSMRSMNGSISGSLVGNSGNEADKKVIADYQSQVTSLQQRLEDLEITLREKEAEAIRMKDEGMQRESSILQERKEWQEDKFELESKIATLESQQDALGEEISKAKADYEATERSLQDQIENLNQALDDQDRGSGEPRGCSDDDYGTLLAQHEELKAELQEQREVTEEVRKEATEFLKEMKELSERSAESWEREEKLSQQLNKLQEEVKEWKSRYARAKTQLRSIRATSLGLALQQPGVSLAARDGGFTDASGIIKDVHVTKFQIAIDDMLRTARGVDPAVVLDHMKTVVMAARAITESVDQATAVTLGLEDTDVVAKLKSRVSATANNLITAAKNHATANGLSPVSLLDAAASHLTASVVELVKKVKIRPSPPGELDEVADELVKDDPRISQHSRQYSVTSSSTQGYGQSSTRRESTRDTPDRQRTVTPTKFTPPPSAQQSTPPKFATPIAVPPRLSTDSVYSSSSSPRQSSMASRGGASGNVNWGKRDGLSMMSPPRDIPRGPQGFGVRTEQNNVEELKLFVENHFEGIVESIQALLATIRSDGDMDTLRSQIFEIADVVGRVVHSTQSSMSLTGNMMLRERGQATVGKLADCRTKMLDMADQGEGVIGSSGKEFKGKLAGLSFDMAREIKELVKTVEDIDTEVRQGGYQGLDINVHDILNDDDLR
ncbi:hypothetical protein L211DRAFT_826363 [Terfezia boudieri ATCC MYA-4762]|uniref:GIT Spa2 homology (SHD) domain-containing protein n=1 Tax=Terfezia boudieri ATCC MYA-4762 TaxID=1051890 RepID=A0A3N4LJA8_9PEZI|nr:hypothetical protein L211DRAFT_826363 [Terfezia boudieri ATCC MYA-4762]